MGTYRINPPAAARPPLLKPELDVGGCGCADARLFEKLVVGVGSGDLDEVLSARRNGLASHISMTAVEQRLDGVSREARRSFAMETKRQLDVLNRRLGESRYLAGDEYTIADIAVFPWYGGLIRGWLYGAAEFLSVYDYKNIHRWTDEILARPAVIRGRKVNRISGELSDQLHERHTANDFNTKTQDKMNRVQV